MDLKKDLFIMIYHKIEIVFKRKMGTNILHGF
jgi:hypothetical protein